MSGILSELKKMPRSNLFVALLIFVTATGYSITYAIERATPVPCQSVRAEVKFNFDHLSDLPKQLTDFAHHRLYELAQATKGNDCFLQITITPPEDDGKLPLESGSDTAFQLRTDLYKRGKIVSHSDVKWQYTLTSGIESSIDRLLQGKYIAYKDREIFEMIRPEAVAAKFCDWEKGYNIKPKSQDLSAYKSYSYESIYTLGMRDPCPSCADLVGTWYLPKRRIVTVMPEDIDAYVATWGRDLNGSVSILFPGPISADIGEIDGPTKIAVSGTDRDHIIFNRINVPGTKPDVVITEKGFSDKYGKWIIDKIALTLEIKGKKQWEARHIYFTHREKIYQHYCPGAVSIQSHILNEPARIVK